jgi:hypothetical protein|eukprot:COSAG01_NODE_1844_length_9071_cov_95.343067_3_plen_319_part_00
MAEVMERALQTQATGDELEEAAALGRLGLVALVRASHAPGADASPSPLRLSISERLLGDSVAVGVERESRIELALPENQIGRARLALRWLGVALVYATTGMLGWYAMHSLYFGLPDTPLLQEKELEPCTDNEFAQKSQKATHAIISSAPLWARGVLIVAGAQVCFRKAANLRGGEALAVQLLMGSAGGSGSSSAGAALIGWNAVVGGATSAPQPGWVVACEARGLTQRQAVGIASAKTVLWHFSQPLAYLAVLGSFRCIVIGLGPAQTALASVVALREMLYVMSVLLAIWTCPVFLLIDLRAVWREVGPAQRFVRLAM